MMVKEEKENEKFIDATWVPHVRSWLNTMPPLISKNEAVSLAVIGLYKWLVPAMVGVVTDELKTEQMIPFSGIALVHSLNRMFGCVLQTHWEGYGDVDKSTNFDDDEEEDDDDDEEESGALSGSGDTGSTNDLSDEQIISLVDSMFLFSVVWSFGATMTEEGRKKFDISFRSLCSGKEEGHRPPRAFESKGSMVPSGSDRTVFDFFLQIENLVTGGRRVQWVAWKDMIKEEATLPIDSEATFDSIIVPTCEGRCLKELLDVLVTWGMHPLVTGAGGAGKTAYMQDFLSERMKPRTKTDEMSGGSRAEYCFRKMQFSTFTTPPDIQSNVLEGMLKRKATRTITSKSSKKTLFIIDDVNMPEKEVYGSQPPLELLRQGTFLFFCFCFFFKLNFGNFLLIFFDFFSSSSFLS